MGTQWRSAAARAGRAVRRRLPLVGGRPRPDLPEPGPQERLAARLGQAVTVMQALERTARVVPGPAPPREFLTLDRVVRRADLPPALEHIAPPALRGGWEGRDGVRRLTLPLAADAVVLAKFDLAARVKLRAAYGGAGLGVAVHPAGRDGTSGATRAARSAELVGRHAPGLAPASRGTGDLAGGYHYLVEEWVEGEPLASDRRLAEQLEPLLHALSQVHAGYGVHRRRASQLWPAFSADWRSVREAGLVDGATPGVLDGATYAAVAALLGQDRQLRISWTHGDLAPSNVFATQRGLTVIDWEQAAERPVMFDGARLQLFASRPARTRDLLEQVWGAAGGPGGYSPAQELALLHARFLCDAPARLARMAGHGRQEAYARQLRRQARLLTELLPG